MVHIFSSLKKMILPPFDFKSFKIFLSFWTLFSFIDVVQMWHLDNL